MSTSTLHIGKTRTISFAGSDGSAVPAGTLTAVSAFPLIASVSVNPTTNVATVTGVTTGSAGITFSAPNYLPDIEVFSVAPLPSLVPTIGPET